MSKPGAAVEVTKNGCSIPSILQGGKKNGQSKIL